MKRRRKGNRRKTIMVTLKTNKEMKMDEKYEEKGKVYNEEQEKRRRKKQDK